ncbi:F-box domain-containing protein [Mycena kentingensis (nom. inval.)]|nr:F-box domain-containing protein [Mycena kentingensis (nom. inval.)]
MPRPALDILPYELWEIIFRQEHTASELLGCAKLCHCFNELCLRIYLEGRGWTPEKLFAAEIPAISEDILPVLALYNPARPLAVRKFACTLPGSMHTKQRIAALGSLVGSLASVVSRATKLEELSVTFAYDIIANARRVQDGRKILRALCGVLSAATKRVNGPVYVLTDGAIHSCRPQDIAGWKLERFQYNPLAGKGQDVSPSSSGPWSVDTRLHTGKTAQVRPLRCITSLSLRVSGDGGHSILILDPRSISYISLRDDAFPLDPILASLSLPSLRTVNVHSATIDPRGLRTLLVNHPGVVRMEYHTSPPSPGVPRPLIEPPLAHPGLIELATIASAGRLIPALIDSPHLRVLSYSLPAFLPLTKSDAFLADLRAIAARTPAQDDSDATPAPHASRFIASDRENRLTLKLSFYERRQYWLWNSHRLKASNPALAFASHPRLPDIVAGLDTVRAVYLTFWSMHAAQRAIPFLALFPANSLEDVDFGLEGVKDSVQYQHAPWSRKSKKEHTLTFKDMERFLDGVRRQLPGVKSVTCDRNGVRN